ncbi:MAG: hypothetical protein JW819_04225 [Candidatus Krumholzibacteriota bacterium]|nr:hypothetical protein [Candidatus Krumholzibacteriota bacterium]
MKANRFTILVAALLGLAAVLLFGAGWTVIRAGSFHVEVHEGGPDGCDFSITVPAALVQAVAACVPGDVLAVCDAEAAEELARWWPLIESASEALARCPDCELVRVEGYQETVVVAARGGQLCVDVDDHGDRVRVAVPVRCAAGIVQRLVPDA